MNSVWSDRNWRRRVHNRVEELGFATVDVFVMHNIRQPMSMLAETLGDDIAEAQLIQVYLEESSIHGRASAAQRELLARALCGLVGGWTSGESFRKKLRMVLSSWVADVLSVEDGVSREEALMIVSKIYNDFSVVDGWAPVGGEDPELAIIWHGVVGAKSS